MSVRWLCVVDLWFKLFLCWFSLCFMSSANYVGGPFLCNVHTYIVYLNAIPVYFIMLWVVAKQKKKGGGWPRETFKSALSKIYGAEWSNPPYLCRRLNVCFLGLRRHLLLLFFLIILIFDRHYIIIILFLIIHSAFQLLLLSHNYLHIWKASCYYYYVSIILVIIIHFN